MRMRLTQDVEQEADGRRELTVEVFVHARRGGVAEIQPAGAEWRVRWLRGTADLNRQGSGTAMVRVTVPGLYRGRSVASARRGRSGPLPLPAMALSGLPRQVAAASACGCILPMLLWAN
ncbi:uncharacterized protein STAUR_2579 [Stigmatella aurantiaca DW4/3-1]|uniref:Uncharacterized protein n=1 Tax=Stigmatella aurantiaca (strain DW4/3-1) TaxID=378806 RepID=E3FHW1_STIAD|nr:uncharacterized protein STAUR_2579 [Stigmatella aurantiaca DW4/3-1]